VNWTVYNTSNSELPSNWVYSIAIDGQGNKWIGTDGGLAVYREGGIILPVEGKEKAY
jgi:ligand-binding sensor domain-containing protein